MACPMHCVKEETHSSSVSFRPRPYSNNSDFRAVVKPWKDDSTTISRDNDSLRSATKTAWDWVFPVVVVTAITLLPIVGFSNYVASGSTRGQFRASARSANNVPHKLNRRGTCGNNPVDPNAYSEGLHVGALFILLTLSSLSCGLPVMARSFPKLRIPEPFFFAARHFGTGVILGTAFVHLLVECFEMLGDPCLSSFWHDQYSAMAGAITLGSVFIVVLLEMFLSPARRLIAADAASAAAERRDRECANVSDEGNDESKHKEKATVTPQVGLDSTHGCCSGDLGGLVRPAGSSNHQHQDIVDDNVGDIEKPLYTLSAEQRKQKAILRCMMLELGILFHSVFVGMAMAVTPTNTAGFAGFLVAICFHQTFEGLALGARIATIDWPKRSLQPWLMALAFGTTTPIGQAIGIGTHRLYDPESEFGLILVGTTEGISAGLLVFTGLVDLLSQDFLSDESWRNLRGKKRALGFGVCFFGAFCMSLVGAWA